MTENAWGFVNALTELIERETTTVDREWRNAALDDRARERVVEELRPLVFELVAEAMRSAFAARQEEATR